MVLSNDMSKLLVCRVALAASTLLLLFLTYRITATDRLEAKIVDDRTGDPVAATVCDYRRRREVS